jgi:hypothetical protein
VSEEGAGEADGITENEDDGTGCDSRGPRPGNGVCEGLYPAIDIRDGGGTNPLAS